MIPGPATDLNDCNEDTTNFQKEIQHDPLPFLRESS